MTSDIQEIIDRAVAIATRAAVNGKPVAQIIWILPSSASQDRFGTFASIPYTSSASCTPPWEKY